MSICKSQRAVAIIQARHTSTRLPGKVLLPLGDDSVLRRVIGRVAATPGIDAVCVAVPDGVAHDAVAGHAAGVAGCRVVRGPENDVLARYVAAARETEADYVLRVTSDCPAIDPGVCGMVLQAAIGTRSYARTSFDSGFPLGLDTEAMPAAYLHLAATEATDTDEREHVTPFIWRRPERFSQTVIERLPDRRSWRLTLDEQDDYEVFQRIEKGMDGAFASADFAALEKFLLSQPDILAVNHTVVHKTVARESKT